MGASVRRLEARRVSTDFVQIQGHSLRVMRSGKGAPVLLIMGLGGCIESWEPLRHALTGHELLLVDHPGMGQSSVPSAPIPMAGLASIYADLLTALGHDQVDVLGYSFGGTVAQQMAHQHPGRVRRLVLAATACGWGGVPLTLSAMAASASPMRYYSRAYRESVAPYLYAGRTGREPSLLDGQVVHRPSLQGLMWQLAAYSAWTSLPWLHQLIQPTLVIGGEEDPMAPAANSVLLARRIPEAQLYIVPQGGHLFLFDETPTVVPIIKGFLRETRSARTA
jgi:poly(3-hydroxyalkanoate) depolymerase